MICYPFLLLIIGNPNLCSHYYNPRCHLQYLRHPAPILNNTELYEETGQTVLVVLLAGLGVVPGQLLKLQTKQHNLVQNSISIRLVVY